MPVAMKTCLRFLSVLGLGFVLSINAWADLFVESVTSTTVGVSTDIDYISTNQTPTDGDFHKVVVILDDYVIAESLTSSGTLSVTFPQPGTINYIVRSYDVDGDAIDSIERSINVFGIAVVEPENNQLVGLGSRLFIGASAIFQDKLVDSVEFQYRSLGGGDYSSISGSNDRTSPYSFLYEPPSTGLWEIRAVAFHSDGSWTASSSITLQVAASNVTQPSYTTILDPSDGSTVQAGVLRTINVDVSSRTGVVRGVDMYVDGELLNSTSGMDVSFPFAFNWTPMRPGNYSLVAIVTDNAGMKWASNEVEVTATDDRPHAELILPSDGATFEAGKHISLVAVATGQGGALERVQGVEFLVNGNMIGSQDQVAPFSVEWTPEFQGQYFIQARVIDSVTGSSYQTPSIMVNIAAASTPVASMLAPYQGDFFYTGEIVDLKATARDSNGIIESMDFFVNDVNVGEGEAGDGIFHLEYEFKNPGVYSISARATSDKGRMVNSNVISITVALTDGERPTVFITNPTQGQLFNTGDSVQLVASARDIDSSVKQVQFYVNQTPIGEPDTLFPFTVDNYVFETSGLYRFYAEATDSSGNLSQKSFVEVRVQDPGYSRPAVEITNPLKDAVFEVGNTIYIEANATDADGTVSEVRFEIDGTQLGDADTSYPFQSAFYTVNSPGLYRVTVTAYDNEGYMSTPAKTTFYVIPLSEVDGPQYDPLSDDRDFLTQLYLDLFSRGPTDAESNRYLEKLEFGTMTRAQVVEALYPTAEFQNLRHSQNAFQAIMGVWPSPLELASALGGITETTPTSTGTTEDDVGNTFSQATVLSSDNNTFAGVLEQNGDVDMFAFQVTTETLVTVYTSGPFDTIGVLYNSNEQTIEYNDDSGEFFNFAIQRALTPGIYYIAVAGWAGGAGSYTLNLVLGDDVTVPQDSEISNAELNSTIQFIYDSSAYTNIYGPVQSMDADSNRRAIFKQLFANRYGVQPTAQQTLQASNRIVSAGSLTSFTASFIRNDKVGLTDYIYNLPDVTSRDDAAFLIRSLLKIRPQSSRIQALENLSLAEKVETIFASSDYTGRFLSSEETGSAPATTSIGRKSTVGEPTSISTSTTLNLPSGDPIVAENPFFQIKANAAGWKYVEWLGWISDADYPWIYHEKLGWIQVSAINPEELWVWQERIDWSYTAAGIFPMVFRYSDGTWLQLQFGNEPGEFNLLPTTD